MQELQATQARNKELQEVIRQQEDHILNLEMELQDLTGKWEYLNKELQEMELQKEIQKEINAS